MTEPATDERVHHLYCLVKEWNGRLEDVEYMIRKLERAVIVLMTAVDELHERNGDIDESCGIGAAMEVLAYLRTDREMLRRMNLVLVSLELSKDEEYEIRCCLSRASNRILDGQLWLQENEFDEQLNRIEPNE